MDISRNDYVEQLYAKSWNGKVKIITGIQRSGKSYLLSRLYKQFLLDKGVKASCFVEIDLENPSHAAYRNPTPCMNMYFTNAKTSGANTMSSLMKYNEATRSRMRMWMNRRSRRKIGTNFISRFMTF